MSTSITLTTSQAEAILHLCQAIKNSPDDTTVAAISGRSLADKVEGLAIASLHNAEAADNDTMATAVMRKNATYAEDKINQATELVDKTTNALAKAEKALESANSSMASYYFMKNGPVGPASEQARKAMTQAGLAILELEANLVEK